MGADMDYRKLMEFYKNKRVLVTGHTGFKGSWMCRVLLLAGAEVCGYAENFCHIGGIHFA